MDVERSNECIGLNGTRRTSSITNPNVNVVSAVNNEINNPNVNVTVVANNTTNPDSIVVNNEALPQAQNPPSTTSWSLWYTTQTQNWKK